MFLIVENIHDMLEWDSAKIFFCWNFNQCHTFSLRVLRKETKATISLGFKCSKLAVQLPALEFPILLSVRKYVFFPSCVWTVPPSLKHLFYLLVGQDLNFLPPLEEKRGFSMLARWRPFSTIGRQRSSIREHNSRISAKLALPDLDIVSAETRALLRPVGQPLRWG